MAITVAKGSGPQATPKSVAPSPWSPFRSRAFTVIWTATVVANIGSWMYNAAAGWLMTSLDTDALSVSLVQVASGLPMFLFAMPAGALADIVNKRRFMIVVETAITILSAFFAAIVWVQLATPGLVLLFMFLIGTGAALTAPAWQSIVPLLVSRPELAPAIAANSVGINISRAVGPALGGVIIAAFGLAAPFWLNAISNIGTVGALVWWRSPQKRAGRLPAERFISAVRTGFRYARHNRHLRATLMRAVGFFLFASAYWALLPLVARIQIAGGPELYGILLGAIGAGAVGGAFFLPWAKAKIGADWVVKAGTIGTAIALALFGLAHDPVTAVLASAVAGISWIAVVASLNVSAQVALPEWVRGRGLAMFGTVFFGAMTLGSAVWGEAGRIAGLPLTHYIAAAGILLTIPLTSRWKLRTGAGIDLTPSMHWPAPVLAQSIDGDRGPVLVTIEYRVLPEHRVTFITALERVEHERRRDGAYAWGVFEDTAEPGRFVETFVVESWLEHLRQHERVTNADRVLQERVHRLLEDTPVVTHLIAAELGREPFKARRL